jgi:hypothetical protein
MRRSSVHFGVAVCWGEGGEVSPDGTVEILRTAEGAALRMTVLLLGGL